MQEKERYTLQELYDFLPITLVELSRQSGINEVTLARIRDGETARRDTANKLMRAFSQVYGRDLSIANVSGINVMRNRRLEKKAAREAAEQKQNEPSAV